MAALFSFAAEEKNVTANRSTAFVRIGLPIPDRVGVVGDGSAESLSWNSVLAKVTLTGVSALREVNGADRIGRA